MSSGNASCHCLFVALHGSLAAVPDKPLICLNISQVLEVLSAPLVA
jgi:hypothetical protein